MVLLLTRLTLASTGSHLTMRGGSEIKTLQVGAILTKRHEVYTIYVNQSRENIPNRSDGAASLSLHRCTEYSEIAFSCCVGHR
jgi:hypothetical protein